MIGRTTKGRRRFLYADLDSAGEHEVDWVTGAYLMVRASAVADGPLLDEAVFMYFEDTLLCIRVQRAGYKIMYLPIAPVVHYRGRSARKARYASILYSFQGSKVFIDRQHGRLVGLVYRLAVVVAWAALVLLFGVLGLVAGSRFREKSQLFRFLLREEQNAWSGSDHHRS